MIIREEITIIKKKINVMNMKVSWFDFILRNAFYTALHYIP